MYYVVVIQAEGPDEEEGTMAALRSAPALDVATWANGPAMSLEALLGRVIVLGVFSTRSRPCRETLAPQLLRVASTFHGSQVQVLGLHSAFDPVREETEDELADFLEEQHIRFPVAIDRRTAANAMPSTMQAFGIGGAPTLVLIDKKGARRQQTLGIVSDLALGAAIMSLVMEPAPSAARAAA
jgi:thiol-disulfide isomerase/thioredoxin